MPEKTNDDPKRPEHGDQDSDREVWILTDNNCDEMSNEEICRGVFTSAWPAIEALGQTKFDGLTQTFKAMHPKTARRYELIFRLENNTSVSYFLSAFTLDRFFTP